MKAHIGAVGHLNAARLMAILALLLLLEGAAGAQQGETPARLHLGPVDIAPTLVIRDIGVDSNVYNTDPPISDFTLTAAPTFVATAGRRWLNLHVRSTTDLVYFMQQDSERSVDEDLLARVRFPLRHVSPFVEAAYINTRQRFNEEIDERARRTGSRGEVGVVISPWPKISGQVSARYTQSAFDADAVFDNTSLARELNRDAASLTGSVRYAISKITGVLVEVDRERTRFTEDAIRDSDSRRVQFGVEMAPRALISGFARVGMQRFRPLHPEVPDFDGMVGSAGLSFRLRPTTTLGATFDRGLSYSYSADVPYYIRSGFGLSVRRQLPRRWDLELSGTRFHNDYRAVLDAAAATFEGRQERFLETTLTGGYQIRPGTRFTAALAFRHRRSDFDDREYDSLRTGVSMSYGF